MMAASHLRKGSRPPSLHPGRQHRHHIDSAPFEWNVSPDGFEALAAKHLAGPGNMLDAAESKIVYFSSLIKGSPTQAQLGVSGEFSQKKLKIGFFKREIGIETYHEIVFKHLHSLIARVERADFSGKIPAVARRQRHQLQPIVLAGVASDNLLGSVRGSVAHNDPSHRPDGLRNHGLDGELDEFLLIPSRRDDDVFRDGLHCTYARAWQPDETSGPAEADWGAPWIFPSRWARPLKMVPCPQWSMGVLFTAQPRSR